MATHVDDCNAACTSFSRDPETEAMRFKSSISTNFEYKEKDPRHRANLLGMTIHYNVNEGYVKLSVKLKILQALERYGLTDANPSKTPMATNALQIFERDTSDPPETAPWPYAHLVGELLWMATILRVDIAFATNLLARYMHRPKLIHWSAAQRVLRYLKATMEIGIVFRINGDDTPTAYSDSDWAGDLSDRKSVTGYVFMFKGGPVAWKSRKQTAVAKSTAEAEYVAVSACAQEAIWFRQFFAEINRPFSKPFVIHTDNQAAIQMTENPVYLSKTKHIDIAAHHVRDEVDKGSICLVHTPGDKNPADILTKPLGSVRHYACMDLLGMA